MERLDRLEGRATVPRSPIVFHPAAERAQAQRKDELRMLRARIAGEERERRELDAGLPKARQKHEARMREIDAAHARAVANLDAQRDALDDQRRADMQAAGEPLRELEAKVNG